MSNVRTHQVATPCLTKRSLRALALLSAGFVSASLLAAETLDLTQSSACDERYAAMAQSARDLQDLIDRCIGTEPVFSKAILKLNLLPPPPVRPVAFKAAPSGAGVEAVRYEADVFFNYMQTYPPEIAFSKLDDLLRLVDQSVAIRSVSVLGSADPIETQEGLAPLAQQRAEFIKHLLLSAGIPAEKLFASVRSPRFPDTPEGRARDRSVGIAIELVRTRPTAKAQ
jgi:hypothetical protein